MKNKYLHIFIGLIFSVFAFVQWNDPDPWGWIFFYSSIALVAFFFAFNKSYLPATIGLLICSIVCAGSLVPSFIEWINSGMPSIVSEMKAESPHIEYVREFLGLILSIIVILVYYFLQKKQASSIS